MRKKPWIQVHLEVPKAQAPLVELLFENLGACAVTLGDAGDDPMLEPAPGETPLWRDTRVTGLFDADTDIDALRSHIDQALSGPVSQGVEIEVLENRDWERAWLERFRPMRFGRRLWIRPGGQEIPQEDGVVVDLDPGLAFGTGTHPTTALCLEWLDGAELAGREVIDYGCGSGILSIAALKLGARHAIGVDHDPQALIATRENAHRNAVAERLETRGTADFQPRQAPLVMANILANVLIELRPQLTALVAPGGELVLSGILTEQAEQVVSAYSGEELRFARAMERDGWVLLHARRQASQEPYS